MTDQDSWPDLSPIAAEPVYGPTASPGRTEPFTVLSIRLQISRQTDDGQSLSLIAQDYISPDDDAGGMFSRLLTSLHSRLALLEADAESLPDLVEQLRTENAQLRQSRDKALAMTDTIFRAYRNVKEQLETPTDYPF